MGSPAEDEKSKIHFSLSRANWHAVSRSAKFDFAGYQRNCIVTDQLSWSRPIEGLCFHLSGWHEKTQLWKFNSLQNKTKKKTQEELKVELHYSSSPLLLMLLLLLALSGRRRRQTLFIGVLLFTFYISRIQLKFAHKKTMYWKTLRMNLDVRLSLQRGLKFVPGKKTVVLSCSVPKRTLFVAVITSTFCSRCSREGYDEREAARKKKDSFIKNVPVPASSWEKYP